jgi:hypothetical protein
MRRSDTINNEPVQLELPIEFGDHDRCPQYCPDHERRCTNLQHSAGTHTCPGDLQGHRFYERQVA